MQPIPYFGEKIEGNWIVEPKIDGWRMQIIRYENGETECWGRRLEQKPNWSEKLHPIIKKATKIIPAGNILDTELYSSGGRRFIPSIFAKNLKVKPIIYVFDIIYHKGEFIGEMPLNERKELLRSIKFSEPFRLLEYKKLIDIKSDFEKAIENDCEGIVIKKSNSLYLVGKEVPIATHYWRKVK